VVAESGEHSQVRMLGDIHVAWLHLNERKRLCPCAAGQRNQKSHRTAKLRRTAGKNPDHQGNGGCQGSRCEEI
jgi:hypothetical protein